MTEYDVDWNTVTSSSNWSALFHFKMCKQIFGELTCHGGAHYGLSFGRTCIGWTTQGTRWRRDFGVRDTKDSRRPEWERCRSKWPQSVCTNRKLCINYRSSWCGSDIGMNLARPQGKAKAGLHGLRVRVQWTANEGAALERLKEHDLIIRLLYMAHEDKQ
jgi:hypothetical protein